jgi:phosphonate transport system ATP-binding protein
MRVRLKHVTGHHPAAERDAVPAVRNVSLTIEPGEKVAVIGPSGAGKTTFLQVICAAIKPSDGEVFLDETDIWSLSTHHLQKVRGRLICAPQVPPLPPRQRVITSLIAGTLPSMSLMQSLVNLIYPLKTSEAYQSLEAFDVHDKLWNRVDRLSGGERQRVGLARVLMSPASLWLIDEPLSALDPTRAEQAINSLLAHAAARGATLVATLHQVDVATSKFSRVIGLRDGAIAFDLPASKVTASELSKLYAQHEHELSHLHAHRDTLSPLA